MADEADMANDLAAKYLQINIEAARSHSNSKRDAEATICGACDYAKLKIWNPMRHMDRLFSRR